MHTQEKKEDPDDPDVRFSWQRIQSNVKDFKQS